MKIKPLGNRIVTRPLEDGGTTKSGIVIPDTAKERPQQGEVVAVGAGAVDKQGKRMTPGVKVGDRILYGKYSGSEVTVDDAEYVILSEDDILAVLG